MDLRVLHHDEGVNYFFANEILETGRFIYEPLNYHGPFYFFALALSFLIFGISEFSLRFPAAVFGILIAVLPLFLLKGREKYFISLFLLFSPSLMYYSRYSIHEGAFVLFSFLAVYFFSLILHRRDLKYLPVFSIALAFMFVTKETSIIMLFILFIIVIVNFRRIREINFKENYKGILISVLLFLFIYILFFSSFFLNFNGLRDSIRAFFPWIDRGLNEIGHDKPFFYYSLLLLEYELPIFLFFLIGLVYFFRFYRRDIFVLNFFIWGILSFIIYSLIPYKTPWLLINIIVPMCFVAGFMFDNLNRRWKFLLFGISVIYLFSAAFYLNFVEPWQSDNKLAYVHTDKDVLNLVDRIDDGDGPILIVSKEYWPLPFYLHGRNVSYTEGKFEGYGNYSGYDFFVFDSREFNEDDLPSGFDFENYRLRSGVELILRRKI